MNSFNSEENYGLKIKSKDIQDNFLDLSIKKTESKEVKTI